MSPEWSGQDPAPPNTRHGDRPSILHRDIEGWTRGLRGGPLRVQDTERKRRRASFAASSDRWMWFTLAVVAAGFLSAVVMYR